FHGLQHLLQSVPIIGSIIQIAATAICVAVLACGVTLAALTAAGAAAFVTGVTSGNLGMALKAGLIAGATALAFNAVGTLTSGPGPASFLENVAGHALVGCASSVASGGTCKSGALSAGVTALAGPFINGNRFSAVSLVANSVLGGLASVAGGGKFANGAVTGAFGYLFNQLMHV